MKKYLVTVAMVLLSLTCYSAEWIAIGEQPELSDTGQIEIQLWIYVVAESKSKFKPQETF